jgi:hypothetical protein
MIAFAHMYSTRGGSWRSKIMSKAIQWWTGSKYFHTEVIFNGYWYTADVFSGKVIKRRLRPLKDRYDYTAIALTKKEREVIEKYLTSMMSRKYDLKTIVFSHILGMSYNKHNEVYCTELGLKTLHSIGLCNEYPDNGSITPKTFYKCTAEIGQSNTNLTELYQWQKEQKRDFIPL